MFLSRMRLDPRQRRVRRDLGDRYELHRTVMCAFPDAEHGRAELGVLFRLEVDGASPTLYVQSHAQPDWAALPPGYVAADFLEGPPQPKPLGEAFASLVDGQELRFRLQANPRRQLFVKGGRGRRVPLRAPADVFDWLARRAKESGFSLRRLTTGAPAVGLRALDDVVGWKRKSAGGRRKLTLGAVQFDGHLRVEDVGAFRAALETGIGGGKALGLGLLSIAPTGD